MPTGEGYIGGGAQLRPRDLLKIGQAYLDGGAWNGRRIVTADWVRTRPRRGWRSARRRPATAKRNSATIMAAAPTPGLAHESGDGERPTVPGYAATGNGGQVLLVIPEHELAVVFTGGNYRQGGVWGRWAQQIVGDQILPAIRR